MTIKSKRIFGMLALAVSIATLVTIAPTETKASKKVKKYSVWHNDPHNGHTLCLPWPAVEAHLREHEGDVLLGSCGGRNDAPAD